MICFLGSASVGLNAHANSDTVICHDDEAMVEATREELDYQHSSWTKRTNTMVAWFQSASHTEISEIWGEPTIDENIVRWAIPMELARPAYHDVFKQHEKFCVSHQNSQRAMIIEDNVSELVEDQRNIKFVITMGVNPSALQRLIK